MFDVLTFPQGPVFSAQPMGLSTDIARDIGLRDGIAYPGANELPGNVPEGSGYKSSPVTPPPLKPGRPVGAKPWINPHSPAFATGLPIALGYLPLAGAGAFALGAGSSVAASILAGTAIAAPAFVLAIGALAYNAIPYGMVSPWLIDFIWGKGSSLAKANSEINVGMYEALPKYLRYAKDAVSFTTHFAARFAAMYAYSLASPFVAAANSPYIASGKNAHIIHHDSSR